jgi:hypothetical protein
MMRCKQHETSIKNTLVITQHYAGNVNIPSADYVSETSSLGCKTSKRESVLASMGQGIKGAGREGRTRNIECSGSLQLYGIWDTSMLA